MGKYFIPINTDIPYSVKIIVDKMQKKWSELVEGRWRMCGAF